MKISCHCGNHQLVVAAPKEVTVCNCSVCSRYSAIWGYYNPADVTIAAATEAAYAWGDKSYEFVRCDNCGCVTHYRTFPGDPKPLIAVNFQMVPAAEIAAIPVQYFDGATLL